MMQISRTMRVLAFMEANFVTGPAKNLIEFARRASQHQPGFPRAEVSIATFVRGDGENPFIGAVRRAGLELRIVNERFVFDPKVISQIQSLSASRQPDIIETHNVKSHFLARLTNMHLRHCWVAFQHGYTWIDLKDQAYNQLDRWSLRAAHQVVTLCRPFALALEKTGVRPERILVQHNTVNPFTPASPQHVLELRRSLGIGSGTLILFCAGRLSKEKGHLDLVQAVAQVRRECPDALFHLVIAGEGPERNSIQEAAAKLGVSHLLSLCGYQPDLVPYYTMSDIVVLPSHTEGSPNVMLEAMAAGLPVVATSVGGVPEIAIDGETALLVEARNPQALAGGIRRLLTEALFRKELGAAAQRRATLYDPDAYCKSILQLYCRLLNSHSNVADSWSCVSQ
jgi:glycosyltransferase involved in cell wall biosynthesis